MKDPKPKSACMRKVNVPAWSTRNGMRICKETRETAPVSDSANSALSKAYYLTHTTSAQPARLLDAHNRRLYSFKAATE